MKPKATWTHAKNIGMRVAGTRMGWLQGGRILEHTLVQACIDNKLNAHISCLANLSHTYKHVHMGLVSHA